MVDCPGGPDPQQSASISTFNSTEFPEVRVTPEEWLSRRGPAERDGGSGLTKETPGLGDQPRGSLPQPRSQLSLLL